MIHRGRLMICLSCGELKRTCHCDDIIKLMQSQLEHNYEEYKIFKKITMNCINKQIHNNTEGVSLWY
mgnify:CR=1 FL=1